MFTYLWNRFKEPTSGAAIILAVAFTVSVLLVWVHGGPLNLDILATAWIMAAVVVLIPEATATFEWVKGEATLAAYDSEAYAKAIADQIVNHLRSLLSTSDPSLPPAAAPQAAPSQSPEVPQ